jgi:hypothetical protein
MASENNEEWAWASFAKDGEVIESKWVVTRSGALMTTRGGWASDRTKNAVGYLQNSIWVGGKMYQVLRHRLVARAFVANPRPALFGEVDHVNGTRTDNRACNLRWVNSRLNHLNQTSKTCRGDPKCKTKPFQARVKFLGRNHYLGMYKTAEECKKVQDYTRKSLFEALYHYHTRPNTFLEPERWTFSPCCVRVKRV